MPLRLVLAPKLAARETFDEVAMGELIDSIRAMGILQPLVVEEEGQFFRIHAGHRRSIAAGALELETVPCRIYRAGTIHGEAAKAHENAFREDLNPAEEAIWFNTLYETECGQDTNKLAALVKRPRAFVEDRLLLVQRDPDVFEALKAGLIKVGVAEELNLVTDRGQRMVFLTAAVQGGATRAWVKRWRQQYEAALQYDPQLPQGAAVEGTQPPPKYDNPMRCFLCDKTDEAHTFMLLWVHGPCKRLVLDPTLERMGLGEVEPSE